MRIILPLAALLLIAGGADAQSNSGPQDAGAVSTTATTAPPDTGRPSPNARDGLGTRGATAPVVNTTFAERIGSPIYNPIGTTVNSQAPAPR